MSDPAPITVWSGLWFWVDDGAGKIVKCYCANGAWLGLIGGEYARMVGSLTGPNPTDWYYNQFHYVQWKPGFPVDCTISRSWPWEFHTFEWNLTVLN